jgi:hypothetical protein
MEKGRRLENMFWRIWGSERNHREFSGALVSAMFMKVYTSDDIPSHVPSKSIPEPESDDGPEGELLSRPSLEIQYPPTPPPSPVSGSLYQGTANHSFLSKNPELTKITASLQQVVVRPRPPPSPPPRRLSVGGAVSPATVNVPIQPKAEKSTASAPKARKLSLPEQQSSSSPSQQGTLSTVEEDEASEWVSASFQSKDSRSSINNPGVNPKIVRADRLRRGVRKKATLPVRGNRSRGIPPSIVPKQQRNAAPKLVRNKLNHETSKDPPESTTNSLQSSTISPKHPTLPTPELDDSQGQSTMPSREGGGKGSLGAWIVDPDFRTKYIEQKQKVLEMTARAPTTTALAQNVVTAHIYRSEGLESSSKRAGRGGLSGRRKNVLDEVVPLKGVDELQKDVNTGQVQGMGKIGLPRQKSQLSMLFENAKRAIDPVQVKEDPVVARARRRKEAEKRNRR